MREIKFRVWSKIGAKMSPCATLKELLYSANDPEIQKLDGFDEKYVVFMQYTGFRDRKGKEIYEGDILRQSFKGRQVVGIMEWEVSRGQFGMNAVVDFDPGSDHVLIKLSEEEAPEVIGNIYQNPELVPLEK